MLNLNTNVRVNGKFLKLEQTSPGDKLGPNVGPQTITKHQPHSMSVFFRAWRRVYQVATDLSNVLSCCHLGGGDFGLSSKLMFGKSTHLVLDTVFPVVGCREFIPENCMM